MTMISALLLPLIWMCSFHCDASALPLARYHNQNQFDLNRFLVEYDGYQNDLSSRKSRSLENVTSTCDLCGSLGSSFIENEIFDPDWNTTISCQALGDYFGSLSSDDDECSPTNLFYFLPICCDMSVLPPKYQCETNVRSNILDSYETAVPPNSHYGNLDVDSVIDFFHITDIDLKSSTVEVFVWITLSWTDPRLAWELSGENCAGTVSLFASMDVEKTDIWVPEVNLYNRFSGLESFGDAMATVDNTGRVTWLRDGGIRALCSFVGLRRMPFDELGCEFVFGVKSRYDINLKMNELSEGEIGVDGVRFPEYVQTYNEYQVMKEKTVSETMGLGFLVQFYFKRADRHYLWFVMIPNMMFTYLAFGQFLLETSDRLGFGVNMMLILVAQGIITAEILPICNENLWINTMNVASMMFTVAALATSILIGYLYSQVEKESVVEKKHDEASSEELEVAQAGEEQEKDGAHEIDDKIEKMMEATNKFSFRLSYQKTKLLDKICMFVFFVSYTIFLIVRYKGNYKLEDDPDDIWGN